MAIEIEVSEFVTTHIFAGVNPEVLYDIRRPLKREGRRLWFDKFRPGKEFWGMKSTPAQGTETELTVQLNGGSIDTDAIGSRSHTSPAGGRA